MEYGGPSLLVRVVFSSSIALNKKPPPYSTKQFVIHNILVVKMIGTTGTTGTTKNTMDKTKTPLTVEEIAQLTQWSKMTVRRLERSGLKKLRDGLLEAGIDHDDLNDYLKRVLNL